ncbi:hypothetical protein ZIOFF_067214 [Zingiber officinale]|uniref:Uncharacterized protein n=1 Tax=Zingiber officinale TaxID=94328 RepID=A0A8J5ESM7_ZINOF|nr:hypothetical protein ZIOFF_067214 [Zingiber officinale]
MRARRPPQHLVVRKLRKLKMVVPGCRTAELQVLLRKTTEYVSYLELKDLTTGKIDCSCSLINPPIHRLYFLGYQEEAELSLNPSLTILTSIEHSANEVTNNVT